MQKKKFRDENIEIILTNAFSFVTLYNKTWFDIRLILSEFYYQDFLNIFDI